MKVLFKDMKHGEIKLVAENLDDIWHLYNIIEEDDLVRAVTFRTDECQDDKIRSKKSSKKRMKLGIRVKEVNFHRFSDRLRIHGIIEEGPQDLGSFHTFNIDAEKMDPVSIIKEDWRDHQLKRIDEAVRLRKLPILTFICLDDDTATVAVLHQSGVKEVAEIDSNRSGKMYEDQSKDTVKEYYGDIIQVVKNNKQPGSTVIVLGPGFAGENFAKYARQKEPGIFEKTVVHKTGNTGMSGINEAIKTGVIKQITKENRVCFETNLVERLFTEIKKNGLASYGEKDVEHSLKNGAVERLLIVDTIARTKKGEKLLLLAKDNQSDFTIVNTMHDAGKKLEGIGGVGAILRFKI